MSDQKRGSIKKTLASFAATLVLVVGVCGADAVPQENTEADQHGIRSSYQACLDASDAVTPVMKDCMGEEMTYQDQRLNAAYGRLMSRDGLDKAALRSDERLWLKWRDERCDVGSNAGQADDLVAYNCMVRETAVRASVLEAMFKN